MATFLGLEGGVTTKDSGLTDSTRGPQHSLPKAIDLRECWTCGQVDVCTSDLNFSAPLTRAFYIAALL